MASGRITDESQPSRLLKSDVLANGFDWAMADPLSFLCDPSRPPLGDPLSMPAQDRVGSASGMNLLELFAAK